MIGKTNREFDPLGREVGVHSFYIVRRATDRLPRWIILCFQPTAQLYTFKR
jgi:hypothetical protein